MRLAGKVAIVTGGARGLGREYVRALYGEGARVVVADVRDADDAVREIDVRGGEALALMTDVSDEESAQEMARATMERFGRIDILINNAAISTTIEKKPFYEISADEWDRVMAVNVKGAFLCCKAVYPCMKAQKKGKIINVSSGVFFKGLPHFIHYVTSKGGIIGFTRALAREVGDDGICVNVISPGYTMTDYIKEHAHHSDEMAAALIASRCFKREAMPGDLTGAILFLASRESDFVTGQTLVVDGGSVFL